MHKYNQILHINGEKHCLFIVFFIFSETMHSGNEIYEKHEFHIFFFSDYSVSALKVKRLHSIPQKGTYDTAL